MLQYYWKQLNDRCSGYLVTRVVVQMLGDLSGNKLTNCVTPREKCVTLCILTHSLKLTQGATITPVCYGQLASFLDILCLQFLVACNAKLFLHTASNQNLEWGKTWGQGYWSLEGPLTNLLISGDVLPIQLCITWHTCGLEKFVPGFPFRICPKLREKFQNRKPRFEAIEK